MDGADGSGLDIISGNVVNDRKVVFAINRNQLRGIMQARLPDEDTMNVTVSVRVDKAMVPVIGMSLKRVDDAPVGAIAQAIEAAFPTRRAGPRRRATSAAGRATIAAVHLIRAVRSRSQHLS